jgi:hypothetical protein
MPCAMAVVTTLDLTDRRGHRVTARWFFGVALLLGLVVASIPASEAEETPTRIFHIGIVTGTPRSFPEHVAFEDRLRELGYVEGRNLTIDFVQDYNLHRLAVVGEFARRGLDVIVVSAEGALKAAVTATAAHTSRSSSGRSTSTRWQEATSPVLLIRAAI